MVLWRKGSCSHLSVERPGTLRTWLQKEQQLNLRLGNELGAEISNVRRRMWIPPKASLGIHRNISKVLGFPLYLMGVWGIFLLLLMEGKELEKQVTQSWLFTCYLIYSSQPSHEVGMVLFSPHYRWGHWDSKRLSTESKHIEPGCGCATHWPLKGPQWQVSK